jgi:hypothetical protein
MIIITQNMDGVDRFMLLSDSSSGERKRKKKKKKTPAKDESRVNLAPSPPSIVTKFEYENEDLQIMETSISVTKGTKKSNNIQKKANFDTSDNPKSTLSPEIKKNITVIEHPPSSSVRTSELNMLLDFDDIVSVLNFVK